jgi:hypothetical protein
MTPEELWPKVRSAPLTRDELRVLRERAQDCASDEAIRRDRASWELRAGLWQALAQAALACESLIARDELFSIWGEPGGERENGG